MNYDDESSLMAAIGRWALFCFAIVAVLTMLYLWLAPTWRDMETRGIEHGYAATTTKRELLIKLAADYERLEADRQREHDPAVAATLAAQEKATRARMRSEAAELPPDEVPAVARPLVEGP